MTDLFPLFLLLQCVPELCAERHMVRVLQHHTHHLARELLEPVNRYNLTELDPKQQQTGRRQRDTHRAEEQSTKAVCK